MIKNYIKIALRNMKRKKGFTFINIFGLAVGLACSNLIFVYILDELSYDAFHEKSDRIYRLESNLLPSDGSISRLATNGWPAGRMLAAEYGEIEECVYMRSARHPVKHENMYFFEKMIYVSENFFNVFSFPLIKGNPETALDNPFTIVISDEMEKKYFNDTSALGNTLILSDSLEFTITGVVKTPKKSHIQFDMLLSFSTYLKFNPEAGGSSGWGNFNMSNYLLLRSGVSPEQFQDKIRDFPMRKAGDKFNRWGFKVYQNITPLENIYLRSDRGNNFGPVSSIKTIYFLIVIAGLLLSIACFNFVNLSTARSVERAKEVGLRKVVGSTRNGLVKQFLTESLFISCIAMIVSAFMMVLSLPAFNSLIGKQYIVQDLFKIYNILFFIILTVAVALSAGIYPSFVLSRFKPVDVLRGNYSTGRRGVSLRKAIVILQFIITSALIFCTLIVRGQLFYMLKSDPGFNKDQIVVMDTSRIPSSMFSAKSKVIKSALEENPSIYSVTASNTVPGRSGWRGQVCYPEGRPKNDMIGVEFIPVDYDYVKTFDLKIISGRDFSMDMSTDEDNALLINEASVKAMGWETPENALGKKIDSPSGYPRGVVVGVFKDYNHHSLQTRVNSIVLDASNPPYGLIALKISNDNVSNVLDDMLEKWNEFFPGYPFDYFFLDEFFDRQYRDEIRLSKIFGTFSILTIIIAYLGLFGLIAFSASQRTKEIGIRKVLGASVSGISIDFIKDYLKLISGAFIVAIPVAYILMERWLSGFAYRIEIGIEIILLTTLLTYTLAVLTVSFRAVKAARANPVDSIKYE